MLLIFENFSSSFLFIFDLFLIRGFFSQMFWCFLRGERIVNEERFINQINRCNFYGSLNRIKNICDRYDQRQEKGKGGRRKRCPNKVRAARFSWAMPGIQASRRCTVGCDEEKVVNYQPIIKMFANYQKHDSIIDHLLSIKKLKQQNKNLLSICFLLIFLCVNFLDLLLIKKLK